MGADLGGGDNVAILGKSIVTARKRSLRQGNIFAPVCHSVHGGEYLGRYPPGQVHPLASTPPSRYTPFWAGTPPAGTPPQAGTSGRYASYWNAFLLSFNAVSLIIPNRESVHKIWRRSDFVYFNETF